MDTALSASLSGVLEAADATLGVIPLGPGGRSPGSASIPGGPSSAPGAEARGHTGSPDGDYNEACFTLESDDDDDDDSEEPVPLSPQPLLGSGRARGSSYDSTVSPRTTGGGGRVSISGASCCSSLLTDRPRCTH